MPRVWHNLKDVGKIDDVEKKALYEKIAAARKPYFMIYIYPSLKRDYTAYAKSTRVKCLREFGVSVDELKEKRERTDAEDEFLAKYDKWLPVGMGGCVTNRICKLVERRFDGILSIKPEGGEYDYANYKSGVRYERRHYRLVSELYEEFLARVQAFMRGGAMARASDDEADSRQIIVEEFKQRCSMVPVTREQLTDIVIDVCYRRNASKQFAWDICGEDIVMNLLRRNGGTLTYPTRDEAEPEFMYGGEGFSMAIADVTSTPDEA